MAGLFETMVQHLFGKKAVRRSGASTKGMTTKTTYGTRDGASKVVLQPKEDIEETEGSKMPVYDRTFSRERTKEVGREDLLLSQIDEFREKAQQLQNLLLSKESKVAELQNIVDEREGKARELEDILSERQKQADVISEEMTKQIDALIGKVTAKMDEIGTSITSSVNDSVGRELTEARQLSEKQIEELNELKELLATVTPQLETVKVELSDKIHSENVKCYRNILDLFKSMEEKMEVVDETQQKVATVSKCSIALIILTLINLLGVAAVVLLELGIFHL